MNQLNLSLCHLASADHWPASCLGRILQLHPRLAHLDISHTKLGFGELLFVAMKLKQSSLKAIHMTQGNFSDMDLNCRVLIRQALNARLKHPLCSAVQLFGRQANNMILSLNSYVMSCLPPEVPKLKRQLKEAERMKLDKSKPTISSMEDVHERLEQYRIHLEEERRRVADD